MTIQIIDQLPMIAFWLAFTRWLTIVMQLPIFDDLAIPTLVKILTSLVLTYAFFPFVQAEVYKDIHYIGVDNFWYLTFYNAIVGLAIGFFVKSLMNIFIGSGAIITQQVGFAAVRYFDPSAGQQVGPFEKLIKWTLLVMVITSGALLPMFKGIINSFFSVHVYDMGKMAHSSVFYLRLFKGIFMAAIMLSTPIIFINVLLMSVLGFIARTVPQMNVLMVSFVVNIGMGLLVFAAGSDEFFHVAYKLYTDKLGEWFQFIL